MRPALSTSAEHFRTSTMYLKPQTREGQIALFSESDINEGPFFDDRNTKTSPLCFSWVFLIYHFSSAFLESTIHNKERIRTKRVRFPFWLSGSSTHVLVSIVDSISACHAEDRGSIPRRGGSFSQNNPLMQPGRCAPAHPLRRFRGGRL